MDEILEKLRTASRNARMYLCERSLLAFSVFYFSEFFLYLIPGFHQDFYSDCEDLADGILREALWIAFRESAKTSIAKIFVVWCICFNKKKYICYDSYDKENSESALFDIVDALQTNKKILNDFGHLYTEERKKDKPLKKGINSFITANKIKVVAHSTQESLRGLVMGNARPDLFVLDDIETDKTKSSRKVTLKIIKHIKELRGGLGVDAATLYVGNFITETGVIAYLKKKVEGEPTAILRNIPVEDDKGNILWEDKYVKTDKEASEINKFINNRKQHKVSLQYKKRDLGERSYAENMMNDPESAGEPFFNRKKLDEAIKKCTPPIEIDGGMLLWDDYFNDHRYALGADTSKGIGLDSNTSVGIDFSVTPNRQIASYASNKIAPDIFGLELHRQSKVFGVCLVAPETNASSGGTCLTSLRTVHPIEKIFRQRHVGKAGDPVKKDLGWETNRATKPEMFFAFRSAWEEGDIEICDVRILKEMRKYTYADLTNDMTEEEDEELDEEMTRHFDLLIATCICYAMRFFATVSDESGGEYEQPQYEKPGIKSNITSVAPTLSPKTKIDLLASRNHHKSDDSYETDTPWQAPGIR